MKNMVIFLFLIICLSNQLSPMEKFNALPELCKAIVNEAIDDQKHPFDSPLNIVLDKIPEQYPTDTRHALFERCVDIVIDKNSNEINILIPILEFIIKPEDISSDIFQCLHLTKDSFLLNYAIFKHNALSKINKKFPLFYIISKNITISSTIMTKEHLKLSRIITSFRTSGKTFIPIGIDDPSCKPTNEAQTLYWETALKPTFYPDIFQSGQESESKWSIRDLTERAKIFLLCQKELYTKTGIKLPKLLTNNCIFKQHIFAQPLKAIEKHFSLVGAQIEKQISAYNSYLAEMREWKPSSDTDFDKEHTRLSIQQKFFDNFPQWYKKECDKILEEKFALIERLIKYCK